MSSASPAAAASRQVFIYLDDSLQRVTLPSSAGSPLSASVGDGFFGLVTSSGELYMAGDNESGQSGVGPRQIDHIQPQRVNLAGSGDDALARSVATGMRFTIVATAAGAQSFGGNDYKQLGRAQQTMSRAEQDRASMVPNADGSFSMITPHHGGAELDGFLPDEIKKVGVRAVATALHAGFVVANDGHVYGCGHKGYGLTEPRVNFKEDYWTFTEQLTRIPMPNDARIIAVSAEYQSAFALTDTGHIIQWGTPFSSGGGLRGWGFSSAEPAAAVVEPAFITPTLRNDIEGVEAITGQAMALVRGKDGRTSVYSLGLNDASPKLFSGSEDVVQISYNLALRMDGIVLEQGAGGYKQSTTLVAPAGHKVVHVAMGRCGKPIIIVEAIA